MEQGPGKNNMPLWGVILLGLYLITGTLFCVATITQMWPHPTPTGVRPPENTPAADLDPKYVRLRCRGDRRCIQCEEEAHALRKHLRLGDRENDPECTNLFGRDIVLWNERRLVFIVILAGMIGGFLHTLRSFFMYAGRRALVTSWIWLYLLSPFTSALLAVVIYLLIRGGFFSGMSTVADTSPYSFAALAALVGMFNKQTSQKLIQIFETIFTPGEEDKDAMSKYPAPAVDPAAVTIARPAAKTPLTIKGSGFIAETTVKLGSKSLYASKISDHELTVEIAPEDLGTGDTAALVITNPSPGGGTATLKLTITA